VQCSATPLNDSRNLQADTLELRPTRPAVPGPFKPPTAEVSMKLSLCEQERFIRSRVLA
jgi:hypothetical protein